MACNLGFRFDKAIAFMTESTFMREFLVGSFRGLFLSTWLGAALFFSFVVTQTAFAVLPSSQMAGAIVNETLTIINYSGLVIGFVLLLTSFLSKSTDFMVWIERAMFLVLSLCCALSQFVVSAWMHGLRQQIDKPVDELPADDPFKKGFAELHDYSVILLAIAMTAALIAYFLITRRIRKSYEYAGNN